MRARSIGIVALAASLIGCAAKPPKAPEESALPFLKAQSAQVKTVSGRIHVVVRSKEGNITFPAEIAIDRTHPDKPKLRLAALGPMDVTYALLMLKPDANGAAELTWLDFDKRMRSTVRGTWQGLPLEELAELMLGLAPVREDTKGLSATRDALSFATPCCKISQKLAWLEGEHPVVETLNGETAGGGKYEAKFKDHASAKDLWLPAETEIKGQEDLYLRLNWRERKLNGALPAKVFDLPKTGF